MQAVAVASLKAGKLDSPKTHNTELVQAQRAAFFLYLWALSFVPDQFKIAHFSKHSLSVINPVFAFSPHLWTLPRRAAQSRATQHGDILPVIILGQMRVSDSLFTPKKTYPFSVNTTQEVVIVSVLFNALLKEADTYFE